jgi:hypothetical protein
MSRTIVDRWKVSMSANQLKEGPPGEFALLLGRLIYFSGWVEHTLGELTVLHHPEREAGTDSGWGLSGRRLVTALKRIDDPAGSIALAIAEYEDLLFWRNKIVHSGWVARGAESVVGFHAPISNGAPTLTSFEISYNIVETMIERWRNLEVVADGLVSAVMGLSDG